MKLKELNQGHFKMRIIQDLGMKPSRGSSSRNIRFAIFECTKCGKPFETSVSGAKSKKQSKCKSCSQQTHGLSTDNLYQRYHNMLSRCYNENANHYSSYGALGVTVCEEWLNSFESFSKWCIENGYKKHLELDKDIKSNKLGISPARYSPETCTFVTAEENSSHKKPIMNSNTSGYRGVTKHKNKFKATINVENKFIHLGLWDTALEAAKSYDFYIIRNNLERPINSVLLKDEVIDLSKLSDNNKSGYHGVFKKEGKFGYNCLVSKGTRKYLGVANTALEASIARIKYIQENNLESVNKI